MDKIIQQGMETLNPILRLHDLISKQILQLELGIQNDNLIKILSPIIIFFMIYMPLKVLHSILSICFSSSQKHNSNNA